MWDVGGQSRIRPLWRHYFTGTDFLIYVIDSNDVARMGEAADELNHLLSDDLLSEAPLLVFANKQDLPNAMSVPKIAEKLGMYVIHISCVLSYCCSHFLFAPLTRSLFRPGSSEG